MRRASAHFTFVWKRIYIQELRVTCNVTTGEPLGLSHPRVPQRSLCFLGGHIRYVRPLTAVSFHFLLLYENTDKQTNRKLRGGKHNYLVLPDINPLLRKVEAGGQGRA